MIFGRTPDLVSGATPEEYRDFFAAVFADLDANPRETGVRFKADDLVIDIVNGNPVFIVGSGKDSASPADSAAATGDTCLPLSPSASTPATGDAESLPLRLQADFRGRWLPEHPVPLRFHGPKLHVLRFVPTTGNRVKVRT